MQHTSMLISVTGRDKPGITSALAGVLAQHHVRIRDIEQVTSGGNLTLSFMVQLDPTDVREHPFFKDFIFTAWELGVHADFRPIAHEGPASSAPGRVYALTVFGEEISAGAIASVATVLAEQGVNIDKIHKLSGDRFSCIEMILSAPEHVDLAQVKQMLLPSGKTHDVNLAVQRESVYRRAKRLIVFDMDSTLVQGEVIDELAARHGIRDQVAAITERAMQGELDFEQSLRERVSLLRGLPVSVLAEVRRELRLTPGAPELIRAVRKLGYKVAVISGGFSYFTNALRAELDLDFAYANELEVRDQRLTGCLLGRIVDATRKADLLETIAQGEGISLDQVIAVGDGANDLQMLKKAGLGIAFNPKTSLREEAEHAIDSPQLDAILYLLGIRGHELEELLEG